MLKNISLLLLATIPGFCQPAYTRLRAAVGGEALGIAPQGQLYTEAFFGYGFRSFANISAGVGLVGRGSYDRSFTFSTAVTYSYLLNPHRRKQCQPRPGANKLESYLEGGPAAFFFDTYDGNRYLPKDQQARLITPLLLAGVRLHFITEKWAYILRVRFTPALVKNNIASRAGIAFAVGWR